jgi:hypothetical protein
MGTAASATDEWMELHNDGGEDVSLDGWTLAAADGEPHVALSGTISAGGYALLERTDDTTVPDIPADVIYTGGLGNSGEVLTLTDAQGAVADTVDGSGSWKIGGDNATKNTAQRQAGGTWITGGPTPRAINTTTSAESGGEVAGASTTKKSVSSAKSGGYRQVVFVYGGEDRDGVVGAAMNFEAFGVDDYNNHLDVGEYDWSFGDGGDGVGAQVAHTYLYPGTYTVVVRARSNYQKSEDTLQVTIRPAQLALEEVAFGTNGFVKIRNNGDQDLDLSSWRLYGQYAVDKNRTSGFSFPEATRIAPHASVVFPYAITRLSLKESDRIAL